MIRKNQRNNFVALVFRTQMPHLIRGSNMHARMKTKQSVCRLLSMRRIFCVMSHLFSDVKLRRILEPVETKDTYRFAV